MNAPPTETDLKRWAPTAEMSSAERRAVGCLRRVSPPDELSEDAWQRIHGALFAAPQRPRGRRSAKLAALGVAGLGLAVAAGLHLSGRHPSRDAEFSSAMPELHGVVAPAPAPPPSTPQAPSAPLELAPTAPERAIAKPLTRPRPPAPGMEPRVPVYPLDAEAHQLGQALHQLRIEKNPDAALEALADYRRRFPGGQLSDEARLAELDANLALGRTDRALELLEDAPGAGPAPRQAELDLLRAGLLVNLGRCGEALPALTRRIEATAGSAPVVARALYLRALCAARDGDSSASRRDLEEYLRRFPDQTEHRAVEEALRRISEP